MDYTIENTLKLTNTALIISGVRIFNTDDNKFWTKFINIIFYFNMIWLQTDVVAEFFWLIEGIHTGKSFSELTFTAPCTTICLLATAKIIPMYNNRHITCKVVEKLSKIQPKFDDNSSFEHKEGFADIFKETNEGIKAVERTIVKDAVKFATAIILLFYYTSGLVIVMFTLLPLLAMSYEYYKNGETDLKLPFLAKYFFDPFTMSRWPLVYIHQVWSTFIAAFYVFGVDTFIYTFCTYAHMHFLILCNRFEHVIGQNAVETRENLTVLVKRHQELIELVNLVEIISSKSTLFNIINSSFLICLSGFNVTVLDNVGAVFAFCTFLLMSISQISLLCFFGDMLLRSSTKVSEAVYKCRWYDADMGTKKSVLLIIMRAQKPCKLTAAKFADLNLSAFTTILSRSWSYFALLKTMYK